MSSHTIQTCVTPKWLTKELYRFEFMLNMARMCAILPQHWEIIRDEIEYELSLTKFNF